VWLTLAVPGIRLLIERSRAHIIANANSFSMFISAVVLAKLVEDVDPAIKVL
jgi:hypothetical protein